MSAPLISFVVPAHNAEATLAACLHSILSPFDERVEALVVENGSIDGTAALLTSLAERDGRVHALSSEPGVSNARNAGVDAARGTWLCFLDADDALLPGALSRLLSDAQGTDADLILYGHRAGEQTRPVTDGAEEERFGADATERVRVRMLENPTRYMQAWAKLIRRSVVTGHGVRFDPRLRLAEDSDFILRVSRFCRGIALSPACVYGYSTSSPGTMRASDGRKAEDYTLAMTVTREAIGTESEAIRSAFIQYVLMHLNVLAVREIYAAGAPKGRTRRMREIASRPVFSDALHALKFSDCRRVRLIPALLLKLGLYRTAGLCFLLRAAGNAKKEGKGERA